MQETAFLLPVKAGAEIPCDPVDMAWSPGKRLSLFPCLPGQVGYSRMKVTLSRTW
jgi:hypothetical protein